MDRGMVKVDDFYRTNVAGIYAIGDIIPTPALAHVASARRYHLRWSHSRSPPYPDRLFEYPFMYVLLAWSFQCRHDREQAKAAGHELKIGKFPFSASGKASASGSKEGFVKIIFDAKYGELLGCHMIGANVTEMIAELVVAKKLETTGMEILKAIHPLPWAEAVMEATAAAYGGWFTSDKMGKVAIISDNHGYYDDELKPHLEGVTRYGMRRYGNLDSIAPFGQWATLEPFMATLMTNPYHCRIISMKSLFMKV